MLVHCPSSASILSATPSHGVPPIVHFVYALRKNAPFGFVQYTAVQSALAVHRPVKILFHHFFLPQDTAFWRAVRPALTLIRHDPDVVTHAAGRCLNHYAHKADWIRLRALVEHGGLYMDLDTFSMSPLPTHVRQGGFVIGKQLPPGSPDEPLPCMAGVHYRANVSGAGVWHCDNTRLVVRNSRGLCNAIMAAAPGSHFGRHWLGQYGRFRSGGKDDWWAEHSVSLPARLWERCDSLRPGLVVLPPRAFFPFYWLEAAALLRSRWSTYARSRLSESYIIHLWGRGAWAVSSGAPNHPSERCSAAYAATVYGHLSCVYAGQITGLDASTAGTL